jgi:hypothetical protein
MNEAQPIPFARPGNAVTPIVIGLVAPRVNFHNRPLTTLSVRDFRDCRECWPNAQAIAKPSPPC